LKENFDRFNLNFTRRSRMVDFRRWILALAVLALFAGLAGAQTGGGQLICGSNVSVTPTLRGEGYTEQTGDITLTCTGGTSITPNLATSVLPTVNITVFLNTAVTSRLFSTGPNISEALLMIDEPGSTVPAVVAGFGPAATQNVCAFPLVGASVPAPNGCQEFASTATATAGGTVAVATDTVAGVTAGKNVFQGVVSGNSVTWFGIPVLAPVTTGISRVFRITNIRANATTLSGGSAAGATPVIASISISGSTSLLITNPTPTVGFVQSGLTTSVSPGSGTSRQQCVTTTRQSISTLTFSENFGTAFKTRVSAQTNTSFAGQAIPGAAGSGTNQNVPGSIYNSESNFVLTTPASATQPAGLADFGTRLKATFNNVPAGTRLFVSVANVVNSITAVVAPAVVGGNVANATTSAYAVLVSSETSPDGNAGVSGFFPFVTATDNATGSSGTVGIAEIPIINGTGTAVWEVVNTNPSNQETLKFGVYTTFVANVAQNSPPPGTATVNLSFAPTPPSFTASAGAAASNTLLVPRFTADPNAAKPVLAINICRTVLLYPFITNQSGFDTGIAIANTSTDPFSTGPQVGTCTLNWFSGATNPAPTVTAAVQSGTVFTALASTTVSGFQGYMIAVCQFQYAHGFAFISDLGARNLAMGYRALVIGDPASQNNSIRNASAPGCGTGDIPCGAGESDAH
jgi:hypothetical protein